MVAVEDGEVGGWGGVRGGLLRRFASVAFCWVARLVKKKKKEGREMEEKRKGEKSI